MKKLLILLIFFAGGCAPYLEQARPALQAYYNGDFRQAELFADEINPRKADRLVSYLDKATIYHSAGKYKKSIKFFSKAIEMAEVRKSEPIAAQAGAVFTNDNVMSYVADDYEHLLMHLYQILNYAALGDYENALVEVRRINTLFPTIYSKNEKRSFMKSPFNAYLSGLIWEGNRLCNDALIDYKRVSKLRPRPSKISRDMDRSAICAGLKQGEKGALRMPNLVVVLEYGRAPIKVSTEYESELQVIPVPMYVTKTKGLDYAKIKVDGVLRGNTEVLEDLDKTLRGALDDEMPGIVARALARLAVKTAGAVVLAEEVDEVLGAVVLSLALATNRADLRSWRTLPRYFQVYSGNVLPGNHRILLDLFSINGKKVRSIKDSITVEEGKQKLLIYRVPY